MHWFDCNTMNFSKPLQCFSKYSTFVLVVLRKEDQVAKNCKTWRLKLEQIFRRCANINPNKTELFDCSFSAKTSYFSISWRTNLVSIKHYFMQSLNSLFRVGWKLKKCWHHLLYADVISFFCNKVLSKNSKNRWK